MVLESILDTIKAFGFIKFGKIVKYWICEGGVPKDERLSARANCIAAAAPQISSFRRHKLFPAVLQQPNDVFETVISH